MELIVLGSVVVFIVILAWKRRHGDGDGSSGGGSSGSGDGGYSDDGGGGDGGDGD
jgi:hypothetical protein